jgi:aminopeptidase-like protein
LAQRLAKTDNRYSYRFLFVPGTIGAITWLALAGRARMNVVHGFVLTCVGDPGPPTYKCSRRGDAEIDQAWKYVLQQGKTPFEIQPFSPYGYDERQFCSPGFDMPVGCFMRSPCGGFPEYHSSADDLNFVRPDALQDSLQRALTVIDVLESNERYLNTKPYGEPKLGNYRLYDVVGGKLADDMRLALLWLLNMSDGSASVLDIATRSGLPWEAIKEALRSLTSVGLLKVASERRRHTRKKRTRA